MCLAINEAFFFRVNTAIAPSTPTSSNGAKLARRLALMRETLSSTADIRRAVNMIVEIPAILTQMQSYASYDYVVRFEQGRTEIESHPTDRPRGEYSGSMLSRT